MDQRCARCFEHTSQATKDPVRYGERGIQDPAEHMDEYLDGFALQEGLLILLRKAAEGIAAKAYRSLELEDEHECLSVLKEAAQTDRAHLLCRYLALVVEKRPHYSPSALR